MEVDALSVMCWVCNETCHLSRDCCYNKDKSEGKGKLGDTSNDGKVECCSCGGKHCARYCTSNTGHKVGGRGQGKGSAKGKNTNNSVQSVESDIGSDKQ